MEPSDYRGKPETCQPTTLDVPRQMSPAPASRPLSAAPGWPQIPGYEIRGELGRGGMGVVYMALDVKRQELVAIKMMLCSGLDWNDSKTRFLQEGRAIALLNHPNIVQLLDIGTLEAQPFFVVEYLSGGSLEKRLQEAPLQIVDAALLVASLAEAIAYAHQRGIWHRDLKPANILLTEDGRGKIVDFGLAKLADEGTLQTLTGTVMGTPSYMSPEQAEGRGKDNGPWTDIYGLGAVLYAALTSRPPFLGKSLLDTLKQVSTSSPVPARLFRPDVPQDLDMVCLTCLEKEPQRRYTSAQALADDLFRFVARKPVAARGIRGWRSWLRAIWESVARQVSS